MATPHPVATRVRPGGRGARWCPGAASRVSRWSLRDRTRSRPEGKGARLHMDEGSVSAPSQRRSTAAPRGDYANLGSRACEHPPERDPGSTTSTRIERGRRPTPTSCPRPATYGDGNRGSADQDVHGLAPTAPPAAAGARLRRRHTSRETPNSAGPQRTAVVPTCSRGLTMAPQPPWARRWRRSQREAGIGPGERRPATGHQRVDGHDLRPGRRRPASPRGADRRHCLQAWSGKATAKPVRADDEIRYRVERETATSRPRAANGRESVSDQGDVRPVPAPGDKASILAAPGAVASRLMSAPGVGAAANVAWLGAPRQRRTAALVPTCSTRRNRSS